MDLQKLPRKLVQANTPENQTDLDRQTEEIRQLKMKRQYLSEEVIREKPRSIDEVFGNVYGPSVSTEERLEMYKKGIDIDALLAVITAKLSQKYGKPISTYTALESTEFRTALSQYLDASDYSKGKKKPQTFVASTQELKSMLDSVSEEAEYNVLLLTAMSDASKERQLNIHMSRNSKEGAEALAEKDRLATLKEEGLITEEEFVKKLEEINNEYIKNSDDEELKTMWNTPSPVSTLSQLGPRGEVPIEDKETATSIVQQVNQNLPQTSDWTMKFDENSRTAKINVGQALTIDTDIYLDPKTGEAIFYLSDKFGHGEKKGPYKMSEITDQIDARQIDGYITEKIQDLTTDVQYIEGIKEIPDDMVVNLGLKLVRKNTERQYSIKDSDRIVLDNLCGALIATDQEGDKKYPTMYDKVKALNSYLSEESNIEPTVKKLLSTENQLTIKELIES